jgi:hypothetical protein
MRTTHLTRSASLLCAAFAFAACGGRDRDMGAADSPAAATIPTPTTTEATATIDVGKRVGADKRVAETTSTFTSRDTMYVSVVTENAPTGAMLTAKWTFEDGQVVDSLSQAVATPATGTQSITEFHVTKPSGWPAGRYTVEVWLDGRSLGTREVTVTR